MRQEQTQSNTTVHATEMHIGYVHLLPTVCRDYVIGVAFKFT